MKKIVFLFVGFLLLFVSCESQKKIENSEQAFDYVKSLKNYISDIRITFTNERGEETLILKQYSSSNNNYRLDLEDERSYIYKDDKIYVKDIKNNTEYFLDETFDEVYRYCFLSEYIKLIYSMDEVEYFEETYDGQVQTFSAKVNLPTNNLNISYAILYLDGSRYIPLRLSIFDSKKEQRILIEYLTFDVLDNIDISLFDY